MQNQIDVNDIIKEDVETSGFNTYTGSLDHMTVNEESIIVGISSTGEVEYYTFDNNTNTIKIISKNKNKIPKPKPTMSTHIQLNINTKQYSLSKEIAKHIPAFAYLFDDSDNLLDNYTNLNRNFNRDDSIMRFYKMLDVLDDEIDGYRIIPFEYIRDILEIFRIMGIPVNYNMGIFSFKISEYQCWYKISLDLDKYIGGFYRIDEIQFFDITKSGENCKFRNKDTFDSIREDTEDIKFLGTYLRFINYNVVLSDISSMVNLQFGEEQVDVNTMNISFDDTENRSERRSRSRHRHRRSRTRHRSEEVIYDSDH